MRRLDMDVMLTNGQGYMVEAVGYDEYMTVAKEVPMVGLHIMFFGSILYLSNQRSTCRNHRAVNSAHSDNRSNLDATGLVACCCARHGCFIPTSVCDLQKGER